jgi:ATP/maltotriose-dependent transcriptional regulator MalT
VALTRDPARRTARALAAAQASLHSGAFEPARESLVAAEMGAPDARQTAQVELLRGQIAFAAGSPAEASALLLAAGRRLEPLDLALARETYLGGCGAAMFAGAAGAADLVAIGEAARALARPPGEPRAIDILLDGLALLLCEGRAAAAATLFRAIEAFSGDEVPTEMSLRWGWMATAACNAVWDDAGLRAITRRHIRLAREVGALEPLPIYLIALCSLSARAGDTEGATSLMAEAEAVADLTGTRMSPFTAQLLLAAFAGSTTEFAALKQPAVDLAANAGQDLIIAVAEWSEAVLFNGLGRYEDALIAARRATSVEGDVYAAMWALPELIEAAARLGERDIATDALDRLAETTRPGGTAYGLGVEARSRALVADDGDAEASYVEAIERLGRSEMRSELARAHLVYGEWLRRARQRRRAREELRTARALFADMGMDAFAERARRELVAAGEEVRPRTPPERDALTPQQEQVAGLARDGLTNAEIATRLFLSPSTVEWHLKNVFAKLGISSRQELRRAMPSRGSSGRPE